MRSKTFNIIKALTTIVIAVAGVSLLACKSTAAVTTPAPVTEEPLLLYRKSPCYGPCPTYEALIYSNGTVQFIPIKYTPVTDTITFTLSAMELSKLKKSLAELNYKNLQNYYKTEWTDMPATHLYFYEAGKEVKHIKHQEGGPESLIRFIEEVHEMLWKYVEAAKEK
ncbi:DUF6438 domain-containing protein [Pontibacter burrus]|uniref:DUF6438 domain-containing protein n=1 Tax=Pontibacter burrus TaxID=2704466 RepID=A0A6B3LU43_9BACT|nr:DUF6438 domain-containing protein [Pontibacter burrus]NEM97518.1 hypothetical protein [Pontibacter burrus]